MDYMEMTMMLSETLKDWLGTFWRILISPTPKTFIEEAEIAKDKLGSAIGWAIFIAIYSYMIPILTGYVFNITILISALLIFPLVVVLVPSAAHFTLKRVFHRKQYLYDKVLYIYTAILVTFQLIITPVTFFISADIVSTLSYLLLFYQFVLLVIATKAIAQIKYWQATATVLSAVIVGATIFICTLPFITSLMSGVTQTLR